MNINKENISNKEIEVLRCNISYKNIDNKTINEGPLKLILKPLNVNAFEMVKEDEKVRLRISEILISKYKKEQELQQN